MIDHAPNWLRLIRENCPLVPEDEKLHTRCLAMRPSREALEAAKQYVITWKHAASIEPLQAAQDNAGRHDANNEHEEATSIEARRLAASLRSINKGIAENA